MVLLLLPRFIGAKSYEMTCSLCGLGRAALFLCGGRVVVGFPRVLIIIEFGPCVSVGIASRALCPGLRVARAARPCVTFFGRGPGLIIVIPGEPLMYNWLTRFFCRLQIISGLGFGENSGVSKCAFCFPHAPGTASNPRVIRGASLRKKTN